LFKTVERDLDLTERTEKQLEDLILGRSLKAGDQLPSQVELAIRLGVSRTVVREAVRKLVARQLLETRRGSGIYVRAWETNFLDEPMRLLAAAQGINGEAITEARELLEVKIARLAAQRANREHIENMEETIRKMQSGTLAPDEFAATDVAFHNHLAEAAGNPLLLAMANSINEVMIGVRLLSIDLYGLPHSCELAIELHARILGHVKAHDVEGAQRAMEEHMAVARKVLEEAEAVSGEKDGSSSPQTP
jgi:GntR family transcriptional regulator, transcriptional repressor for pyruvate dehydrogenase complex